MPPPPRFVNGAVAVWCALAAFCLVHVIYLWAIFGMLAQNVADTGHLSRDAAVPLVESRLITLSVVFVILAAVLVFTALHLRMARRWPRLVLSVVGTITVLVTFVAGLNPASLAIFGLAVAAVLLTWHPTVSGWLAHVADLRERDE
ncbi:hypothetical protein D5S17_16030 [Pseudonocardiaceae bacterium YIM PH 21723]|nr:hypothetical protein D5S17_16030 [Pseudonocardiaceae bacterium YIM PH 21723]